MVLFLTPQGDSRISGVAEGGTIHTGSQPEVLMGLSGAGGPCCAFYVQKGDCKFGKECAYRHVMPGPRDSISYVNMIDKLQNLNLLNLLGF